MFLFGCTPWMPSANDLNPLLIKAGGLVSASGRLDTFQQSLLASLSPMLRMMNSYYTNKIEGQHTLPADIERAVQQQVSSVEQHTSPDQQIARKLRLIQAHILAEQALEQEIQAPIQSMSADTVKLIHRTLYQRLPPCDLVTDEGLSILPGEYRQNNVTAGRHIGPEHDQITSYMNGWQQAYAANCSTEQRIVAIACAHHRLAWIHPFIDGNGRTARLQSHLGLHTLGLTKGIWSPMRGLARHHQSYSDHLTLADRPRRNDMDGRGPLSQEDLARFAEFFIDICQDQADFMHGLLDIRAFKGKINDLLRYLEGNPWQMSNGATAVVKPVETLAPLHYVSTMGEIDRGEFLRMTGLEERTARRVVASLLDYGILQSATHRAPLRFAIPMKSLRFLFPRLWPESEG